MKKRKNSKISFNWIAAFYKKLKGNSDLIALSQAVAFIIAITFFTLFLKRLYSEEQISLKNRQKENKFQRIFFSDWDLQAKTIEGELELKLGTDRNKSKVTVLKGNTGVEFSTRLEKLNKDYDKQKASFSNDNLKIDYQLLDNGIKEEIILNEKPSSNQFVSEFKIKNLKAFYKNNIIVFENKDAEYQFHITEPYAYDATGNVTHAVKYELKEIDAEEILETAFEEKLVTVDLINDKEAIPQEERNKTYQLVTTVDKDWLNSEERVYPITIDPTIVHDTSAEFSTGDYSKTHWNSTDSVIEIDEYGGPEVDANTIGLWSFDKPDTTDGFSATGGTITYDGDYKIHTFTENGTFVANDNITAEVLVVAGGGGGGNDYGGGGGAGGLIHQTNFSISSGSYSITVGSGGAGGGGNGGNSVFSTLTAIGGGGGKNSGGGNGNSGGSGGGCGYLSCSGGTGTAGQGHNGGGGGQSNYYGNGGGGAGEAGGTDGRTHGGDGLQYSISGTATWYAGGGAAAGSGGGGTGGLGGGANGRTGGGDGYNGTPNTGGGGSSSGGLNTTGGSGGSGIVIIKYLNEYDVTEDSSSEENHLKIEGNDQAGITSTGGTITYDGNYKIHTFNSSGTFNINQNATVEVLVVGGGGGGGFNGAGGGGGGQVIYQSSFSVSSGNHSVTVGGGGTRATADGTRAANGGNSVFSTLTAIGGGGGGSKNTYGANGSSGGGGGHNGNAGGTGTAGNNGGTADPYRGGGGGGAGTAGASGASSGNGGNGISSNISGSNTYYGGGGGGGNWNGAPGSGGLGGGGTGAQNSPATAGTANTGGGGGGGGHVANGGQSANGGSGIVIIKVSTSNSTNTNISLTGKIDNGKYFDGIDDYLLSDSDDFNFTSQDFSMDFWINPSDLSNTVIFLGNGTWQADGYYVVLNRWGQLTFRTHQSGAHQDTSTTGGVIEKNKWQHVAFTRDGATITIYVNGADVTNTHGSHINPSSSNGNFVIGTYEDYKDPYYYKGYIDEFRISNTTRTAAEIRETYQKGLSKKSTYYQSEIIDLNNLSTISSLSWDTSTEKSSTEETAKNSTGLVAQWKLNHANGNTAYEAGLNTALDGTLNGFADLSSRDALFGSGWTGKYQKWGLGALVFDGTDDYVSVPYNSSLNLTSSFTLSAWIKTDQSSRGDIVSRFNSASPWPGYNMIKDSTGKLGCWVGDNTNGYVYGNTDLSDNQWHQVSCIYDNNTVYAYVDGKLENNESRTPSLNETSTALRFGDNIVSNAPFDGVIDNISIYSRALDEEEIRANYRATNLELQYRYSSDNITWSNWIGETTNSLLSYSSFNEILDSSTRENLSFSSTDISNKTNLEIKMATDQLGENIEASFGETDFSTLEPDTNTVGLWHFDENENFSETPAWGGTITYVDGYYIHTFTGSGTFSAYQDLNAEVLVVAGGGGGGGIIAGGGGGGGVIHQNSYSVSAGNHTVTIGAGGAGGVGWNYTPQGGSNGGNSVFSTLTAIGGGAGGGYDNTAPGIGGSGGGGSMRFPSGAAGTAGQGNAGGAGDTNNAGGGGGAGEAGENYGRGGNGIISSISGTRKWYGGGGGGGGRDGSGTADIGGLGGGGNGTVTTSKAGDGTANTGGGGGGAGYNGSSSAVLGGTGGSGIVIVRYPDPKLTESKKASGGIVTHKNGKTIHTFISGGTFVADENITAEVLVVAGGGGGGGTIGGGGGAGGLLYNSSFSINSGNYAISVGEGGRGGRGWNYQPSAGTQGGNSVFSTLTAIGGGGGAGHTTSSTTGGSGGGGANSYPTGSFGTVGQGNMGNTGNTNDGGGGGGAGSGGTAYGAGGNGLQYSISGTATWYAGGGGGGGRSGAGTADAGGSGGGGAGSLTSVSATSGTKNTGGGGGGSGYNGNNSAYIGGYGGSGIVIISYDSGGTLEDASSEANHAGKMGNPESVFSKFGNAKYFDGENDYLVIEPTDYNFTSEDFTIDFWMKTTNPNRASILLGNYTYAVKGYDLVLSGASDGALTFRTHQSGIVQSTKTFTGIIETDKWQHVAIIRNGSNATIYIDGQDVTETHGTHINPASSDNDMIIGAYQGNDWFYLGALDELRISNTARSAEEIKQTYELGARTHKLTTNFKADLESSNLITNNSDLIFDISETEYGTTNDIENLYVGDTIIIREVVSTVEYLAEGVVSSANTSTGAVTVDSWLGTSTFPSGGFTTGASVFKWETKYLNIDNLRDDSIDAASEITFRELNDDANFWIKSVRAVSNLDSPVSDLNISNVRYFQYRSIFSSEDPYVSPLLGSVTLEYVQGAGTPIFDSSSIIDDIKTNDRTPTIIFEANSPNSEDLNYEVQWSTDSSFATYSDADSSTDAGFVNTENGGDTAPFTTENAISYTWQSNLSNDNTYFYRVRAKIGSNPGGWSDVRALTTDTSLPNNANTWYQDKTLQFEGNTNGIGISTSSDAITTTTGTYSSLSTKISASSLHSVADYWKELSFSDTETAGDIKYQVMYDDVSTPIAIPDEVLSGNSTGFDDSPIDLTGVSTTTYPDLYVKATLTNTAGSPSLNNWELSLNDRAEIPTQTELTGYRSTTPTFNLYSTDVDNDYLQYKITLCTNSAMTANCQNFDQTVSQTGWSGQNANGNTAYNSGSNAAYTVQSTLQENTTYYWKSIAYDANGSKHWSETQASPSSFTTTTTPQTPDSLLAEGETDPPEVKDITPEFSAIYRDSDSGDYATYYQIQVSTDSSFTSVDMWDTGKTSMSNLAPDSRMPDVSYAGNTLSFNGATYYWRIRFWDSADYPSPWSTSNDLFTMYTLMAPYNCMLVRDPQSNEITISWADNNPEKDSFTIQKRTNFGSFVNLVTGLASTTTEYLDSNISTGNSYQYRITTYSGGVQSPWCNTDLLNIGLGKFHFEGLNLSGLKID